MDARTDVTPIAYVGGAFVPLAEAKVSVLDRGFLFADGAYEVIAAYGGRPFALRAHLARLDRSLRELSIANPHTESQWIDLIGRLLGRNGADDQLVYLQVTRGASAKRGHPFPENTRPTVVGLCQALTLPTPEMQRNGVAAVTRPDIRWQRCDIKSIALLPNVLATQFANEQDCNEAILHRDGLVTEGSSSNVYAVLDGTVVTPPKGPQILAGITRDILLELLRAAALPVEERALSLAELQRAAEIWLTSSTREVLAVARLDGRLVGAGKPGPLWAQAHALFQERKRRDA